MLEFLVLHSEFLVLLIQPTCQDQQDNKATFRTSEAFIAHNATSSKVNINKMDKLSCSQIKCSEWSKYLVQYFKLGGQGVPNTA